MNVRIVYHGDEPLGIVPEEEFWTLENPKDRWSPLMTRARAEEVFVDWRARPGGVCGDSY
jgi:hypothetical protein